jgi:hypothetical protein
MIKQDLVDADAVVEDMVVAAAVVIIAGWLVLRRLAVAALGVVALARTTSSSSSRTRQSPRRHVRSAASFFDSELDQTTANSNIACWILLNEVRLARRSMTSGNGEGRGRQRQERTGESGGKGGKEALWNAITLARALKRRICARLQSCPPVQHHYAAQATRR